MKTFFERPATMFSTLAGPVPARTGVRSDDHGDVAVPELGVPPDAGGTSRWQPGAGESSTPIAPGVEPVRVVDQDAFAFGQDLRCWRCATTPSPSAIRATVRCSITSPSSAQRNARRESFARGSAPPAPLVRLDDPALGHRTVGLEQLPGDLKAELIETGERGQVRATEGSVGHVEVFLSAALEF